jgi:hypothetical protein
MVLSSRFRESSRRSEAMSHGVIALEWDAIGSAFWTIAASLEHRLVMYADRVLEADRGLVDARGENVFKSAFVQSCGGVLVFPEGEQEEYAQYKPSDSGSLVRMCRSCVGSQPEPAAVVPLQMAQGDAFQALRLLSFAQEPLNWRLSERRDLTPLVAELMLGIAGMAYMVGLFYPDPITVCVLPDRGMVEQAIKLSRAAPDFQLLGDW